MSNFQTQEVAKLTGHEPETIRRISRMGIITPPKSNGRYQFSFQDISFLRALSGVINKNNNRYIWSALKKIKSQISDDESLSSLTIHKQKKEILAKSANRIWSAHSGQYLLQFEGIEQLDSSKIDQSKDLIHIFNRALILDEKKKYSEAKKLYLELIEKDPSHARARINFGRIHHNEGDFNSALTHYKEAIELEPDNVVAHFNAGVAYEDLELFDEAILTYLKTIELDMTIAEAHFNLSRLYEHKSDIKASAYHLAYFQILKLSFDI
jgi:tetratricopeptide (TPR) repeat protein